MRVRFNLKEPNSKDKTLILLIARAPYWRTKSGALKKFVWSTQQWIRPADWNKKTMRPKSGRLRLLRDHLNQLERTAEKIYLEHNTGDLSPEDFREALEVAVGRKKPDGEKTPFLLEYVDAYMKTRKRRKNLGTTYTHLRTFLKSEGQKDIRFEDIDMPFAGRLTAYFDNQGYEVSHTNKMMGNLGQFLNAARMDGHHNNTINVGNRQWKRKEVKKEAVPLSREEIIALWELSLSGPEEVVRDWFLISSLTGLRISDLKRMEPRFIGRDDVIRLKPKKTVKYDLVAKIPVRLLDGHFPFTLSALLDKYGQKNPGLPSTYNRILKKLCVRAGINQMITVVDQIGDNVTERKVRKWTEISSHSGRRTFCTYLYNAGYSARQIKVATAHTGEEQVLAYIGIKEEDEISLLLQGPARQAAAGLGMTG